MRIKYAGRFSGDAETLPHGEHMPGAVKFREAENMKVFALFINIAAIAVVIPLMFFVWRRAGAMGFGVGAFFSLLAAVPHELLHAVCFRGEVHLYTNLKQGMLFVTGTETMSRGRFIFMSLLPNLVFGFLPFLIFCFVPSSVLGVFGALGIAAGAGDYYNVFNAATQMPRGARCYMHKLNSYWYMPLPE